MSYVHPLPTNGLRLVDRVVLGVSAFLPTRVPVSRSLEESPREGVHVPDLQVRVWTCTRVVSVQSVVDPGGEVLWVGQRGRGES